VLTYAGRPDDVVAAGKHARTADIAVQRKAAGSGSSTPTLMMKPAAPTADPFDFSYGAAGAAVQKKDAADAAETKPPEDDSAEALLIAFPDFKIDTEFGLLLRHTEPRGNAARILEVARPAAAPAGGRGRAARIVEAQRQAHDLVALLVKQRGGGRRIDAAGHGDRDARH
jgi:hypothetical protein